MVTSLLPFFAPASPRPEVPTENIASRGRLKGYGSPEGRFPARLGQEYVDLVTADQWIKQSDDLQKTGWVLDSPSAVYSQAEVDALISDAVVEATSKFYPLTMDELRAIESESTNRYARVKDDGEGSSRGFWWDNDTDAPDVEPDDFDGTGGWIFDSV